MENSEKVKETLGELVEAMIGRAGDAEASTDLQYFLDGAHLTYDQKRERFATVMAFMCRLAGKSRALQTLIAVNIKRSEGEEVLKRLKAQMSEGAEVKA